MDIMNRPAEVFLQGLQCIEDTICIGDVNMSQACTVTILGRVNMSLVLNMLIHCSPTPSPVTPQTPTTQAIAWQTFVA